MCSEFLSFLGVVLIAILTASAIIAGIWLVLDYVNLRKRVSELEDRDNDLLHVDGFVINEVNRKLSEIETKLNKRGKR